MTPHDQSESRVFAAFTRNNLIAWGLLSCSLGVAVAAVTNYLAPMFEASFNGFGAKVSSLTMFVIHSRHALWALPAGAAISFWAGIRADNSTPARHARVVLILGVRSALTLAVGATVVILLYSPIRELGAAI
jgi:hypothetical protein